MCGVRPGPPTQKPLHLDLAHGRARPERELDRALEIGLDVDQAAVAVHARAELAEGGHRLRRAATERTEELPAGLEQADPRGQQAELEDGATVGTPGIGECVRTQPGGRDVVEPGELRREEVDELGRGAPLLELRTQRLQPLLPSRRERRPRARRELGRALGEHPVVAAEGLVHAPPGDPADRHGDGRTTGRAARSRVNLVGEQAAPCRAARARAARVVPRAARCGSGAGRRSARGAPTRTAPRRTRSPARGRTGAAGVVRSATRRRRTSARPPAHPSRS